MEFQETFMLLYIKQSIRRWNTDISQSHSNFIDARDFA